MEIRRLNENDYHLVFDKDEVIFLDNEAKDNHLTIIEILSMVVGMLFISGYRNIVGKD